MNHELRRLGLTGLARAGETSWFDGHFGAAVLAGYFLLMRSDFSTEVKRGIQDQITKAMETQKNLFEPFSSQALARNPAAEIVEAIRLNVQKLSLSGHGLIYGALALRALSENSEFVEQEVINGIVRLLNLTLEDRKTRYYGISDYTAVETDETDGIPKYDSMNTLVVTAFNECKKLYRDDYVGSTFYYFTAEKLHGITLAHAISTLWELGFQDLTTQSFAIHRKHMILSRMTPPSPENCENRGPMGVHPYQPGYWKKNHFDDHALKLTMATLELLDKLSPEIIQNVYHPDTFWGPFMRH